MWFVATVVTAATATLALVVQEVLTFLRNRDAYHVRRLTLRAVTGGLMLFLLGALFVGVGRFHLDEPIVDPELFLGFWLCIAMLVGALFCLAVADFRMVSEEIAAEAKRTFREVARTLADEGGEKDAATHGSGNGGGA